MKQTPFRNGGVHPGDFSPSSMHHEKTLQPGSATVYTDATRFALDLGASVDYYASRRLTLRFPVGSKLVHYLTGRPDPLQPRSRSCPPSATRRKAMSTSSAARSFVPSILVLPCAIIYWSQSVHNTIRFSKDGSCDVSLSARSFSRWHLPGGLAGNPFPPSKQELSLTQKSPCRSPVERKFLSSSWVSPTRVATIAHPGTNGFSLITIQIHASSIINSRSCKALLRSSVQ